MSSWNWRCLSPARPGIPGVIRMVTPSDRTDGWCGQHTYPRLHESRDWGKRGGPVAILSGSRGDRPHRIYRGFCIQGCKVGAKASTLITHVPDALENGAEIRDRCTVSRIHHDRKANRVTGVRYLDQEGNEHFQKAKVVIVSGYAIETPRLLLNSVSDGFENGLANSSDTVGRYLMAQAGNVILGRFSEPVRTTKRRPPTH